MRILSLCCDEINKELNQHIKKLKIININSLIQDINYHQSLKLEIKENFINKEINNIDADYDFVIIDLMTILKKHIKYKNKILLEEGLLPTLNKKNIRNISNNELLNISLESIDVILNELVSKYHISKIILIKSKISTEYKINENGSFINLNDEDIKYVDEANTLFSRLEENIEIYNPGISITEEITMYMTESSCRSFKVDKGIVDKINKTIEKIEIFNKERIHKSIRNIRYCFEPAKIFNKDKLIIIFSAFSKGKPKYNYIKSLVSIDCNKLYILDDYGEKGCYYLGLNGNLDIETSVMSLLSKIMRENDINFKNIISIGSSKGGSAALYYGIKYNFKEVIVGAPQYKIGSYLSDLSIKQYGIDIFGEINESNRIKYDNLIRKIVSDDTKTKVSILTSDGDNQYLKLLKDIEYLMDHKGIDFSVDKCEIEHHNEIATQFPRYAYDKIVKSLNGKGAIKNGKLINKISKIIKRG